MIILAIDPSIRETGWAVLKRVKYQDRNPQQEFSGPASMAWLEVVDYGVWRPKAEDPYERLGRLCVMMEDLLRDNRSITEIVFETTSGHAAKSHKGGGANLSLYGVAIGGLLTYAECLACDWPELRIHRVLENDWTGGVPKMLRAHRTAHEFGLDVKTNHNALDAIGLGAWWYANRKILEAKRNVQEEEK